MTATADHSYLPGVRRLLTLSLLLLAVFVSAFGGAALANHQFSDVPTGSGFHDEIEEFAGAGCADGFSDGTFRPTESVKRQQMARFFARCGGRVQHDDGNTSTTTTGIDGFVDVATVEMTAPATGFVVVTGVFDAFVTGANVSSCPCAGLIRLVDGVNGAVDQSTQVDGTASGVGQARAAASATAVFPVTAGDTRTFRLQGGFNDANLAQMGFVGRVTALFVPFGA